MAIQFSKSTILTVSRIFYDLQHQVDDGPDGGYLSCLEPDCCNSQDIAENDKMLLNMAAAVHYSLTGEVLAIDGGLCPCNYLTCNDIPSGVVADVIVIEP